MSYLFGRIDNVLTYLRVFKLQQFMKFKRSFRETAILNTGLRFEGKMNFIDVLVKLEAEEVAENLCEDNRNTTVILQNN